VGVEALMEQVAVLVGLDREEGRAEEQGRDRKSFNFRRSPSRTEARALTIVTEEQIRMNVFNAVSQMLRVLPGCGQVGLANRSTMYDPMSPVKNITSEQRKTHIPILSWGMPVADGGSRACSCAIA